MSSEIQNLPTVASKLKYVAAQIMEEFQEQMPDYVKEGLRQEIPDGREYLYITLSEVARNDPSSTYRIDLEIRYGYFFAEGNSKKVRGTDGADYRIFPEPSVRVNWTCYGSMPTKEAASVLGFYSRVVAFAARLEAELAGPAVMLIETAEERAASERVRQEQKDQQAVRAVVASNRNRMRVGHERTGHVHASDGQYRCIFGDKVYDIRVANEQYTFVRST